MSRFASAHSFYAEQLEALAGGVVLLLALDEAAERWGWPERQAWTRMYERFEPDEEPYATLVVARPGPPQLVVRVDAFRDCSPAPEPGAFAVRAGAAGRLHLARLCEDPRLPTLAAALAGPGRRAVVRYRPGRRCTIRVDASGTTRFAKVYGDGRGERVQAGGLALWRAACHGELGFVVAEPDGFDRDLRVVWQRCVAGQPAKDELQLSNGEELARRIGCAAGSLPRSSLRPRVRRARSAELARSAFRCAELERRVPELGPPARQLLRALEAAHAALPASEPRPVHGALHASQWLENGSGLALLDYDSLALGDPELDAAVFLADLDVQNRERVAVERLSGAFLAGYESAAGALDPRLLAAYRAHGRLEKALRVARSVRPDGDRKARRRLDRALAAFGGTA
jgi:hypothetical protein